MIPSELISIATVFLLAALIGLTIVKVVEARMTDISINMPTIKLPQQRITVQIQEEDTGTGLGTKITQKEGKITYNSLETVRNPQAQVVPVSNESVQIGGTHVSPTPTSTSTSTLNGQVCKETLPPARAHFIADNYHSESKVVTKPDSKLPDPSSSAGQRSYPAPYPRNKPVLVAPEQAENGQSYYMDPKSMTMEQLVKFQQRAKFENMTIRDYQNWLLTFKNNPGRLMGFHRANLKVLLRGGQLEPTDMPQRTRIPDSSLDQYTKLLHGQVEDNIPQPEFLGYQPHNYEEQIGHPASHNRNIRHLDYVNPDEPLKTWILTRGTNKL